MATLDFVSEVFQHKNAHLLLRASTDITMGQLVAYTDDSGSSIVPHVFDSGNVTDSARIVGVALGNASNEAFVRVLIDGFLTLSFTDAISNNQVLYESANAGEFDLTQSATAFRVAKLLRLMPNNIYATNNVNPSGLFYFGVRY